MGHMRLAHAEHDMLVPAAKRHDDQSAVTRRAQSGLLAYQLLHVKTESGGSERDALVQSYGAGGCPPREAEAEAPGV